MRWTVNRRIALGFGLLLALMLAIAGVGYSSLRSATREYSQVVDGQHRSVQAATALTAFQKANLALLRYLLEPDDRWLAERTESGEVARAAIGGLRTSDPEGDAAWERAQAQLALWLRGAEASAEARRAGRTDEALRIRDERALAPALEIERLVSGRLAELRRETGDAAGQAEARAVRAEWTLVVAALVALGVGVAAAWLLSRSVAGPLRSTTGTLASAATEILASATEQASGAAQTTAAVTETAATVDQVAQTAEQAAQRARLVSETAHRAAEISRSGRGAVEESVATMDRVRAQVESIAASILALAEQAQSIGEIIATVDEIAGQTNLLALNAAIEASRAGEYGRGFSVVAGEIRGLADQSRRATVQVRQILGEIQRATGTAVMSTEEGSKQVAAGAAQVQRAGETIRALTEAISEAAQAAAQIAASSGQQSVGMAQIRQAMSQIQDAIHQNLAAIRQTERAAEELTGLGGSLLALVGGNGRPALRA